MVEPSMEEIIASISRIIADDSFSARQARTPPAGKTAILELTEAIEPDGSVRSLAATPPAAVPERGDETPPPETAAPGPAEPRIDPAPAREQRSPEPIPDGPRDRILSAPTSEAVATAFLRLGDVSREQRGAGQPSGDGGRSLEAVFCDALRPLLQAWLDDHLPALVERLVREEIQRIAGAAGLR
jgi:hypothetical protein